MKIYLSRHKKESVGATNLLSTYDWEKESIAWRIMRHMQSDTECFIRGVLCDAGLKDQKSSGDGEYRLGLLYSKGGVLGPNQPTMIIRSSSIV